MTTVTNTETLEEIALSIVVRGLPFSAFTNSVDYTNTRAFMAKEILIALRNERERAAKVADRQADSLRRAAHVVQQPTAEALRMAELAIVSVENVARAIREGR